MLHSPQGREAGHLPHALVDSPGRRARQPEVRPLQATRQGGSELVPHRAHHLQALWIGSQMNPNE